MVIPKRIISELGLRDSGWYVGNSFVNDLRIYLYPYPDKKITVSIWECDRDGKPLDDKILVDVKTLHNNLKFLKTTIITKDFLEYVIDLSLVKKVIEESVEDLKKELTS